MFNRLFILLVALSAFSVNVSAKNSDDPFAKLAAVNIGSEVSWKIDKKAVTAVKSSGEDNGVFYHLHFDNKQLKLLISSDAQGASPKKFSQLEIKNVEIDGEQAGIFKWCLNNQERHNRFLQQGLKVKKNICSINGSKGSFILRLNKDTLMSLQNGSILSITLKPFRTPVEVSYDISDFKDMTVALNAKPQSVASAATATASVKSAAKPIKNCWARPPAEYKGVKSVSYNCSDAAGKKGAEATVVESVNQEKDRQRKLAAEKDRQRKLAEEKKQKELAVKLEQEQLLAVEAAALAASQAKQAEIGSDITNKMLKVCEKYWNKGEHRCYCQKYIDHAPSSIQASSTCE